MLKSISAEEIKQLSYFDLLSILGTNSLHPGGFEATKEVFDHVQLSRNSKILEIGCGQGFTTLNLLLSGFNVVACDTNKNMVNVTRQNAVENGFPYFSPVTASAADLPFKGNEFDMVLLEAVFGFISNVERAVREITRVLAPGGFLGIVDMHYTSEPPEHVRDGLYSVIGSNVPVLLKSHWLEFFKDFHLVYWNDYEMQNFKKVDREILKNDLTGSKSIQFKSDVEEVVKVISNRMDSNEEIFAENRKYMKYHVAVWQKRQQTV